MLTNGKWFDDAASAWQFLENGGIVAGYSYPVALSGRYFCYEPQDYQDNPLAQEARRILADNTIWERVHEATKFVGFKKKKK